jgi:hypothetical protein
MVATALVSAATLSAFGPMLAGALATIGTHILSVEGLIENGPNAGAITFQFAQNVSNASAITVKRGSSMVLTPL